MGRNRFFIFFFIAITQLNFSQVKEVESIKQLLKKSSANFITQPDSSLYYLNKATQLCEKKSNFYLSECIYTKGNYFYAHYEDKKSKHLFVKALTLAKKAKNYKIIVQVYNKLAMMDMDKGNYDTSLNKLIYSLNLAEKHRFYENICYTLNNLGILHEVQGDTLKAIEYYLKNKELASQHNFKINQISSYVNIALLLKKKNKPKAIDYLKKAYDLALEINDLNEQFNILNNLSYIYITTNKKENFQKAYKYIIEAEKNIEKTGIKENLFYTNFNKAFYYLKQENYQKAIDYYLTTLKHSTNGINEEQKLRIYCAIADAYKKEGDFDKALLFREKYYNKKDSLFNIEKNKTFNEIQTKYEVEKKNLKINLLTQEKIIEQNRKNKIMYIGLSLILILTILLFFYKHRIKVQKIISEKEKELSNQEKELKRIQGLVEGQNQERNRIAREIHDGVGGKLAGIKLNLTQINAGIQNSKVDQVLTNFSNVFNEIRAISHNLSSSYINENSMNYLINELQNEYNERKEFKIEATIYPENQLVNLEVEVKHQLYRIIQELISNISKHANAKNASINITCHEDFLNIIVQDDGNGFRENASKGVGLQNIRERLQLLNGQLDIEQSPQTGTTIIIDIPNQNLFKQND